MLPFDQAQFLAAFRAYNEAVWPAQVVLAAGALAALAAVARRGPAASRFAAAVLALLWAWMALAYHLAFFSAINPAAYLFAAAFLGAALAFAWNAGRLRFVPEAPAAPLGWVLVATALAAYPVASHALGHRYPEAPTFGLPCPTTIFTLGMLCFAQPRAPLAVWIVPLAWSAIGSTAAFRLGMVEDVALAAAGIAFALAFLRPRAA